MTSKTLTVGSWVSGTTRTEDILDALDSMARSVGYESDRTVEAAHAFDAIVNEDHECDADVCAGDYASECIDDLVDALEEYAPIYCYIGTHEGDGADFGVWPSLEAIDEAIRSGERQDAETVINADDGVRIHVSDHGNVEVYALDSGESLLALV